MSSKVVTLQNGIPKQTSDHYSKAEVDALLESIGSRLNYLESIKLSVERFVINQDNLGFPFLELQNQPLINDTYTISVIVGRLVAEKDSDFELGENAGISRIIWKGDFATDGVEEIGLGDVVIVKYYYEG
jgi:hypothetical protein